MVRRQVAISIFGLIGLGACLGAVLVAADTVSAQTGGAAAPDLTGTYVAIPPDMILPGGLRNAGSPESIPLTPRAVALQKEQDLSTDPAKWCQVIGPFRLMARDQLLFDILPVQSYGRIFMTFEDWSLGRSREIFMGQRPARFDGSTARAVELLGLNPGPQFSWHGSSVGRWEGDTLVVETTNHSEHTWLNGNGARHTDKLRTLERYRLVLNGKYLEARITADDPAMLTAPYTYTRYYERTTLEIPQINCWDGLREPQIPAIPKGYPEIR